MKKVLLIGMLLLVVIITGCGKKENGLSGEMKTITLKDEEYGITTMDYDSNDDFDVQIFGNGRYAAVRITCKNDNFVLNMNHSKDYSENYEKMLKDAEGNMHFKEYTFGDYQGYTYGLDDNSIDFLILLKEEDNNSKVLVGDIQYFKSGDEDKLAKLFETNSVQRLLKSIKFEEETND